MKYLSILLLLFHYSLSSQEYSITGNVVDVKDNDPIEFTAVELA